MAESHFIPSALLSERCILEERDIMMKAHFIVKQVLRLG